MDETPSRGTDESADAVDDDAMEAIGDDATDVAEEDATNAVDDDAVAGAARDVADDVAGPDAGVAGDTPRTLVGDEDDAARSAVGDREILTAFVERAESPLRPPEVAEDLPVPVDDLRDRFDDLAERDLLRRDPDRRSGAAWYLTDEGRSRLDVPDEDAVTDTEAQATATGTGSTARDQETPETPPPEPGEDTVWREYEPPRDAVEAVDVPGTPDQREARERALRAAYGYLREEGRATRSEFVDAVFPVEPGASEDPSDGWWSEVVRPGLEQLPGAEPENDGDAWRFDEDAAPGGAET